MNNAHYQIAQSIANRFSQLSQVEAIAIAGSIVTGRANPSSDVDVYIFPITDIPPGERLSIGLEFSQDAAISDYWGPALGWFDPETGIEVEAMFFTVNWMEDLVLQPLEKYQARMGFTTSFWHTVKVSQILFDRNGWLTGLQEKTNQPYPEKLVQAIVNLNYPLLSTIHASYRIQIGKAIRRHDLIDVNRTLAEFLASYFDILFAVNRVPHPGVKRMLDILDNECEKQPLKMREQVTQLIKSASIPSDEMLGDIDRLVDELKALLQSEGLI